jgi:hypothetical protein
LRFEKVAFAIEFLTRAVGAPSRSCERETGQPASSRATATIGTPSRCAVVEDTVSGVIWLWLTCAPSTKPLAAIRPRGAGADVIHDLTDLPKMLAI